ncbi:MAG TPA: lysophospholipid acyltransferase family protein [Flavobacteriales bacterium]|nr:lysophospholipid acyltransferase family protein [Flavobacteriales bacterium]
MGIIGYYFALPFIYGIALLPFPLLYLLSDFLFLLIYRVFGYRKEVVLTNLRNSFPEKSEAEIKKIVHDFYRWFCDLTLETLKTLTISPKAVKKRMTFEGVDILRDHAEKKQSVILVLGHFGNWELAGQRYSVEKAIPHLHVIYHPLHNKGFDRLMIRMRTRLGAKLYTMKETARAMMRDKPLVTATAFIADQTPSPDRAYWLTFLGQDTPVFFGTEAMAKKLNYPVVYISITRPHRGRYHMRVETLVEDPSRMKEGEITEKHTQRLERDIRIHPDLWLWTHRRWKHKRPTA